MTIQWLIHFGKSSGILFSPNDLDFVDYVIDMFHFDNGVMGKLLVVQARHLASEKEPTTGVLAPDPMKGQMRLTANSLSGYIRSLDGVNGAFEIRLTLHKLHFSPPSVKNRTLVAKNKKADVAEHPKAFRHVGLLFNEPLGRTELLFI